MKHFIFILSMYMLAIGCLPCSDTAHSADDTALENTILIASTVTDNHSDCNDLCSPLCQCACCGTVTFTERSSTFQVAFPLFSYKNRFFAFNTLESSSHIASLFRPPIA